MVNQMGLTIIVLVILMTTVEIKGGNRHQSITRCCGKGGAIYPSTEYPTSSPSPAESPLTVTLVVPLPAKSQPVKYHRGVSIHSKNRGGATLSENRGGAIQSEVTAARPAP